MNKIKKIIGMCFAVVVTFSLIAAGKKATTDPAARIEKKIEKMTEHLSLTETQQTKVREISFSYVEKMKEAKASGMDKDAFKAIRTEKRAAVKEVLTPEQLTKLKALKERKGKKGKKGGDRASHEDRAKERMAKLTEKLGLTNAQVTRINEINLAYAEKRKAIRNNSDKEVAKAEMKALRNEKMTAIKAILTPEQAATLEEMKSNREGKGKGRKGHGRGHKGS